MALAGWVKILFTADTKNVKKGAEETSQVIHKLSLDLKNTNRLLGAGLAAKAIGASIRGFQNLGNVTRQVSHGIETIVTAASDLHEQITASQATFGKYNSIVIEGAERQAKLFGTVKAEYIESANRIGAIGKAAGLTAEDAAKMGVEFSDLANDLASFRNLSYEEALEKLTSGLVGEVRPLRNVGVLLSEQAVKQEAWATGIAKIGTELSEQEKVLARRQLILKGLSDAQGDLARTQGGVANQLRAVRGRLINFAADIGQAFEPITKFVLGGLSLALTNLSESFSSQAGSVKEWASESVQAGGLVNNMIRSIGNGVATMADAFTAALPWILDHIARLIEGLEGVIGAISTVGKVIQGDFSDLGGQGLASALVKNQLGTGDAKEKGIADNLREMADSARNLKGPGEEIRSFFEDWSSGAAMVGESDGFGGVKDQIAGMSEETLKLLDDIDKLREKMDEDGTFFKLDSDAKEFFKLRQRGASVEQLTPIAETLNRKQEFEGWRAKMEATKAALSQRATNPLASAAEQGSQEARNVILRSQGYGRDDAQRKLVENSGKQVDYLAYLREDIKNLPNQIAEAVETTEAF